MKITIAPTDPENMFGPHPQQSVCISVERDDLNMSDMADLFSAACLAYGYTPDAVLNHIRTDDHPPFPAVHGGQK